MEVIMKSEIVIPAALNSRQFTQFAIYNVFIRQKRWIRPVVFFILMSVFGTIFVFSEKQNSPLMAGVLFFIGISLPLVWFLSFLMNVRTQSKKSGLGKEAVLVYTVTLRESGVHILGKDGREADLLWNKVADAPRHSSMTLLYLSDVQAYILPDSCLPCSVQDVSDFIKAHLPSRS